VFVSLDLDSPSDEDLAAVLTLAGDRIDELE